MKAVILLGTLARAMTNAKHDVELVCRSTIEAISALIAMRLVAQQKFASCAGATGQVLYNSSLP